MLDTGCRGVDCCLRLEVGTENGEIGDVGSVRKETRAPRTAGISALQHTFS